MGRRTGLKAAALALLAGWMPRWALAFNKTAFEARSLADVARAYGAGTPAESRDVTITAPELSENGASVLVGAATTLSGAKHLLVLVEKNPNALAAKFDVSEAVEANFQLRIKMAESSAVYALAITQDNRAFFARRDVRVTLGGCAV